MNAIRQHTAKWEHIKRFNLGANDIASLLGVGFDDQTRIIKNKISGAVEVHSPDTEALFDYGNRYESCVRQRYEHRNNIQVETTGLRRYTKPWEFITASPDGYCQPAGGKPHLLELKVRKELSTQVPLKYWVQMQVQMAVWNVDMCLYCENIIQEYDTIDAYKVAVAGSAGRHGHGILQWRDNTYYWSLSEYREQYIQRDSGWWQSVFDKICGYWALIEQGRARESAVVTRSKAKRKAGEAGIGDRPDDELQRRFDFQERHEQTIMPYMLGNYVRADPLIDWLNLYGPAERRDVEVNFFLTMIRMKNREFNQRVTAHIQRQFPDSTYNVYTGQMTDLDIEPHGLKLTYETVQRTQVAMAQQVPIIFNPCFSVPLPSYEYPVGGRADMIILNRYLSTMLGVEVEDDHKDKYSVVNFKYATINLRSDGVHLLNNTKQTVYKAHIWVLNVALGIQQGYQPDCSYIIGRKYDYTRAGVTHRIDNAFGHIGTIDYRDIDSKYEETCRQALDWLHRVRQPSARNWNPFKPEDICQLYPNMKNTSDFPWHHYKQDIAHAIKEITLMYRCGPKVREYAHTKGITEWTALTPDTILYHGGKVASQIMRFVTAGTTAPAPSFTSESLSHISGRGFIQSRPCIEFYMDFEAIGNMYDDFSTFPVAANRAMIFLIGVVIVDHVKGVKEYVSYLADSLTHQAEANMVTRMLSDFRARRLEYSQDYAPVYFWSNAENYMLKRAMGADIVSQEKLLMIDLCKCFREAGLVLPGQTGYSLKDVGRTMHRHNLISTIWKDNANGLSACVDAIRNYHHRDQTARNQHMSDLIDYNYVDCKVMEEIMEYIRSR